MWAVNDPWTVLHDASCMTMLAYDCAVYAQDYFAHGQIKASIALVILSYVARMYARRVAA